MMNIVTILVLLLLAGLLLFLAVRAWKARRAWVKWPGMLLAGLLGLLLLFITGVALKGFYQLNVPPYTYTVGDVTVAGTPEQIARGEQLAYLCVDCHSTTRGLPLDGSKDNLVAGGPPVGVLYASNLTPGGPLKDWSDGEIIRAIREGINRDGQPLLFMSSEPFSHLSDEDTHAIVAWLRAQPAVNRDLPKRDLNILAALFVGAGMAPTSAQPPVTEPVVAPPAGGSEYGRYLIYSSGCRDCHGADLTGGNNPFIPPGPNLTATLRAWNEDQFVTFFKTGVNNTGRKVDTLVMPWETYKHVFTDADLSDMYSYLHGLPMVETAQ